MAPPLMPCRKRLTINTETVDARPQISEVRPKQIRLIRKMRLRPYWSARVPAAINTVVQAMV